MSKANVRMACICWSIPNNVEALSAVEIRRYEFSDLEKAQRQIARLEREKEEFRRKYELLKKAEELERR